MPAVQDGTYRFTRGSNSDQAATTIVNNDQINPVYLLPETVGGKDQEWKVRNLPNGNVIIQQSVSGQYLGYNGDASHMAIAIVSSEVKEWIIEPSRAEQGRFNIVVPGSPEGQKFVLDIALLKIFPPTLGILAYGFQPKQAWDFEKA
ncbi:hypothetical protein M422DRAFT_250155 [Sphaerobolus stellatus SS14]|nr:hypothetical protein M422DRAFT_250155 [Sphaerobolus stellatus SS14]